MDVKECVAILDGHVEPVRTVCFSPDGLFIMSGSSDGCVKLWRMVEIIIE